MLRADENTEGTRGLGFLICRLVIKIELTMWHWCEKSMIHVKLSAQGLAQSNLEVNADSVVIVIITRITQS